ncbi:MAG: hypothetical protein JNN12_00215 [Bacteroidetes Order II. Incertae sedis bacterium]|nr:hypothetical protein [Bacteroidetes Order II. bacterium]
MKTEAMVKELAQLAGKLGIRVVFDAGNFRGGACEVKQRPYLVLNKRHPAEVHVGLLAERLRDMPEEALTVRPAVRKVLEALWQARKPDTPE